MNPIIENLTSQERVALVAGLRLREQRETSADAKLVGALFESQLRILGRQADAAQVRAILNSLRGEAA